ncbi:MAG: L-glutamate gamma-semialdehyde dehydrogenase [Bacteroidales bacterium]|nr:L-glutamate gamma-semialdehyde dehydrogenase [Bacteroidales bacterium]
MENSILHISTPVNEHVFHYERNSEERRLLLDAIESLGKNSVEIPLIIGGKGIRTGDTGKVVCPHDHQKVLAIYHKATEKEILLAIETSLEAKRRWEEVSWIDRAYIMNRAAELISKKYRFTINAATMLGQSKTPYQAEIDSACEVIDFLRYNVYFASLIYQLQPNSNTSQVNRIDYRSLEGFVFTVSPFNFTAIASNLNMSAVMMGNTTVWKPASTALLSNYFLMKIFQEAGLPDGVINFLPGSGSLIGKAVTSHKDLAGIHFTGSNNTFNYLWKSIANNLESFKSYPKLVGETGGKNFIFAHRSAGIKELATAIVRGGFEYQGQKCSAASRVYIPKSLWKELKDLLLEMVSEIKMGDVLDFSNFMNAVIDEPSFDNIMEYIQKAKDSKDCEIMFGGNGDKTVGYFIEPTLILTKDPNFITMREEIFGPVVSLYLYDDIKYEETLEICNHTSPYGLTGAIFGNDIYAVAKAEEILKHAAGNFYVNDKPTGAVVGMQPFGGARASGTNDKAGSIFNLLRWTNPRNIKKQLYPSTDYKYVFMQ